MQSKGHSRWSVTALLVLIILVTVQGYAYSEKLTLSLGPHVVLQPWLMRQGYLLYEHLAEQHSPLMSLSLAALATVCPDGLALAKAVLVALISLSTLLTFWAGQRAAGWWVGLGAAMFFVLWTPLFGFGKLWHETFLAPLYISSLLLYPPPACSHAKTWPIALGFFGGVAILLKQHAAVVVAAWILWNSIVTWRAHHSYRRPLLDVGLFSLAAILPIIAFGVYQFLQAGTLDGVLFWTLRYNMISHYNSLAALPPTVDKIKLIGPAYLLLPAAIWCTISLKSKGDETWQRCGWGLILLVTSSFTAYPRYASFHLQSSLPVLAWLSAITFAHAWRVAGKASFSGSRLVVAGMSVAVITFWLLTAGSAYQKGLQARQPQEIMEYSNLVPLAGEIRQRIGPTACIYIFPDDEATSNLYYLLGCKPPKYWVHSYPWLMLDDIKSRILLSIQENDPAWVVYSPGRWNVEETAPEIMQYIQSHYQRESPLTWEQGQVWLLTRIQ